MGQGDAGASRTSRAGRRAPGRESCRARQTRHTDRQHRRRHRPEPRGMARCSSTRPCRAQRWQRRAPAAGAAASRRAVFRPFARTARWHRSSVCHHDREPLITGQSRQMGEDRSRFMKGARRVHAPVRHPRRPHGGHLPFLEQRADRAVEGMGQDLPGSRPRRASPSTGPLHLGAPGHALGLGGRTRRALEAVTELV